MVKVVILLRAGLSTTSESYNDFLIKLDALPGLRRKAVSDVFGAMSGRMPYHTIIEAYFDSREAMEQALISPEGVAAGRALQRFAGPDATTMYAHTLEEAYPMPVEDAEDGVD